MSTRLSDALALLAQEECTSAIRALRQAGDRHKAIHAARKAIRRLRCILALGKSELGDELIPIDRSLKRVALGLSTLRDAHVVIAAAEKLAGSDEVSKAWRKLAHKLRRECDRILSEALNADPHFSKRCARLCHLGSAIHALPWRKVGEHALTLSLKRTRRHVEESNQLFRQNPTAQNLHQWRRCVRRLRLQLEVFEKLRHIINSHLGSACAYAVMSMRSLAKLSDELGYQQDLQILRRRLRTVADHSTLPYFRDHIRRELQTFKNNLYAQRD